MATIIRIPYDLTTKIDINGSSYDDTNSNKIEFNPGFLFTSAIDTLSNVDNCSNYIIDYILVYFNKVINQILEEDKDNIFNTEFQQFLAYVEEYRRIIIESRESATFDACPPKSTCPPTPRVIYTCNRTFGGVAEHAFTKADQDKLKELIDNKSMNPLIYYTRAQLTTFGFTLKYYGLCGELGFPNLMTDLVKPAVESLLKFVNRPAVPPEDNEFKDLHNTFDNIMADINDSIKNDDYENRYSEIQKNIKVSSAFLSDLTSALNINLESIKDSYDVSKYYENVSFKYSDVDSALIIPKDTDDLVSKKSVMTDFDKSSKRIKRVTSSMISSSQGRKARRSRGGDTILQIKNLYDKLNRKNDITTPDEGLKTLSMTRLYKDTTTGKNVAKVLTEAEKKQLADQINAAQAKYVKRILSYKDPETRRSRYKTNYVNLIGGNKENQVSKYRFLKNNKATISINQSGGNNKISVDEMKIVQTDSLQILNVITAQLKDLNEQYEKQNKIYFDNEIFLDLNNIQQKNYFLIEMMNIIILYTYMLGNTTAQHINFMNSMNGIIDNFGKNLTEYWNLTKSSNVMDVSKDAALKKLLSSGMMSTTQIQTLLISAGLDSGVSSTSDELINQANVISTISNLIKISGGLDNMAIVADKIRNIFGTAGTLDISTDKHVSSKEIFENIFESYNNMATLSNTLQTEYENLKTKSFDINKLKEFTGRVISTNITTAITFIDEMISFVENFDTKLHLVNEIKKHINSSKNRIEKFKIYVKEAKNKLVPYENRIKTGTDNAYFDDPSIKSHNINFNYLEDLYKNSVDNYLTKIVDASDNFVRYHNHDKGYEKINNDKLLLNKIFFDFDSVYKNYIYVTAGGANAGNLQTTVDGVELVSEKYANLLGTKVANVNNFVDAVNNFITYYINKNNGSTRTILFFPHLMSRLKISANVKNIIDMTTVVHKNVIADAANEYFKTTTVGSDTTLDDPTDMGLTKKDQKELLFNILKVVKKSEINQDSLKAPADQNFFKAGVSSSLDKLIDEYTEKETDEIFIKIVNIIKNVNNFGNQLDSKHVKTEITNYIQNYLSTVGADTDDKKKPFVDKIISEFDEFQISFIELLNNLLQEKYSVMDGFSLINQNKNTFFSALQAEQKTSEKINDDVELLKAKINNSKLEDAKIKYIKPGDPTGTLDVTHVAGKQFGPVHKMLSADDVNKLNLLNKADTGTQNPFFHNDKLLNEFSHNFNNFKTYTEPILNLIKRRIRTGVPTVYHGTNAINKTFEFVKNIMLYYPFENLNFIGQTNTPYTPFDPPGMANVMALNPVGATSLTNLVAPYPMHPDPIPPPVPADTLRFYRTLFSDSLTLTGGNFSLDVDFVKNRIDIKTNLETFEFRTNVGSAVIYKDVDDQIKLINSISLLFGYVKQLNKIVDTIRIMRMEDRPTWNTVAAPGSDELIFRRTRKDQLEKVLMVLVEIQNSINSNMLNAKNFSKYNSIAAGNNALQNVLTNVKTLDSTDATFNSRLDTSWFYTRQVVNLWYLLMTNSIRMYICTNYADGVINLIRDFVSHNSMTIENIFNLQEKIVAQNKKTAKYKNLVLGELKTAMNHIKKYKIENQANIKDILDTSMTKYSINQNTIDNVVKYNNYYSNIGKKTSKMYLLMAFIHEDKYIEISKKLENIDVLFDDLFALHKTFGELMDHNFSYNEIYKYTMDKFNVIPTSGKPVKKSGPALLAESIDLLIDRKDFFINKIKHSGIRNVTINTIVNNITNWTNNVITWLNDTGKIPPVKKGDPPLLTIDDYKIKSLNVPITDIPFIKTYNTDFVNKIDHAFANINMVNTHLNKDMYMRLRDGIKSGKPPNSYLDLIERYFTDIYYYVQDNLNSEMNYLTTELKTELTSIGITNMNMLRGFVKKYYGKILNGSIGETVIAKLLYTNSTQFTDLIFNSPFADNTNNTNMKFIIVPNNKYTLNKDLYSKYDTYFRNISRYVNAKLYNFYNNETDIYKNYKTLDKENMQQLTKMGSEMINRNNNLKMLVEMMSTVMFNDHYMSYPFIEKNLLTDKLSDIIKNLEHIFSLIKNKLIDISDNEIKNKIHIGQILNFVAFETVIDKTIGGSEFVDLMYKRISFGVIEYYYDVMDSLLYCLESKTVDTMSEIELYLYTCYYVQIKRCHELFKWLNHDYLPHRQSIYLNEKMSGKKPEIVLKHKIETLQTKGYVNIIFSEFQGLRKYLDEYNAVAMDKVQLHLRINDWENKSYNNSLDKLRADDPASRDVDFMKGYAPEDPKYQQMFDENKMLFTNPDNGRILNINLDLVEDIYKYDTNGATKPFHIYYADTYEKMRSPIKGIPFERIYNPLVYPDSDVIANYMSIAPNIVAGKGTIVMTYGYSGVGKSASLFGKKKTDPGGPTNGILQATLSQFNLDDGKTEVYFRVFEIYGLGVQYNYYWNPDKKEPGSGITGPDCYPENIQYIIHHRIDTAGTSLVSKQAEQVVFTNRQDILSYVGQSSMPHAVITNVNIKEKGDIYVTRENKLEPNLTNSGIFNILASDFSRAKMSESSYVRINKAHYLNFTDFVDSVDNNRRAGVNITRTLTHISKQIKPTINNPDSSRSILVYDFEIVRDVNGTKVAVPFLIYDLPGKEDIYRTFVSSEITASDNDPANKERENILKRKFSGIPGDIDNSIKSTYVTNPVLMPIYKTNGVENVEHIRNVLRKLSSVGRSGLLPDPVPIPPLYNYNVIDPSDKETGAIGVFNIAQERAIVQDIYNYTVTNFSYTNPGDNYKENGVPYQLNTFYKRNPADATLPMPILTFYELFNPDNIANINLINFTIHQGIGSFAFHFNNKTPKDKYVNDIHVLVSIVTIAYLIKYQMFDVVVELISAVVNNGTATNVDSDGGWSRNKIYAFFEAYYINENVVGLLKYLIEKILGTPFHKINSDIAKQETVGQNISDVINKNYKLANKYLPIKLNYEKNKKSVVDNDYNISVDPNSISIPPGDVLRQNEINELLAKIKPEPGSGIFIKYRTPIEDAIKKFSTLISFENKGKYDSNRIFKTGDIQCVVPSADQQITNADKAIYPGLPDTVRETNNPLIEDLLEPYKQKISYYYLFYVVSNGMSQKKAEEQVKLLNNSMPFINKMDPNAKKSKCNS